MTKEPAPAAERPPGHLIRHTAVILVIAAAGYTAVAPAIRGNFISGDDVHLLRDHVLVNHPSFAHAVELFTVVHRDLYQPLHLLSFQLDFAFRGGDPHGMHATNVWLHLVNAVLVYFFLRRVTHAWLIGAVAGLLFAVHPIAVESVAWLNGRTMLLSTGFLLGGMIAFEQFERGRRWGWLVVALLLFVFTMMSKIRVELPALLMLVLVAQRRRPDRRWWVGWSLSTAVAAGFSAFAVKTTAVSEMVETAAKDMPGPPLARAFESLGWYFIHYVYPSGLSPWHPPRIPVAWSDPQVIAGIALTLGLTVASVVVFRWTRTPAVGIAWFLAAIFSTLQVVPTRAILAGERYAYLPNIGLHWIVAAGAAYAFVTVAKPHWRVLIALPAIAAMVGCILVSRETTSYYRSDLAKAQRIVDVYPQTEDVYKDLAWAYIRNNDPLTARRMAEKELTRPQSNQSAALQAVAWTHYMEGDLAKAEAVLEDAIDADPDFGKAFYRMARVQEAKGNLVAAMDDYERCLDITPLYLPALSDLALLYMKLGQLDEAEATYRKILDRVNPYHIPAIYNLGDIYMTQGRVEDAVAQYESMLAWLRDGENARNAATNLALCYERMGRPEDALRAYQRVLENDPAFPYALMNRAALFVRQEQLDRAEADYSALLTADPTNRPALDAMQTLLGRQGLFDELVSVWERAARTRGPAADEWNWVIWNLTLIGRDDGVKELTAWRGEHAPPSVLLDFAAAWRAIGAGRSDEAEQMLRAVLDRDAPPPTELSALTTALEVASVSQPDAPWPFYFVGVVMEAQGQLDVAHIAYTECRKRATDPAWITRADAALSQIQPPDE